MRVAVLLPCYNEQQHVREALGRFLQQTRPPDQIVVVNDGSTDGTDSIVQECAAGDPRITPLRNATNLGAAAATNRALEAAAADYVICASVNDWVAPEFIERTARAAAANPGAALIVTGYRTIDEATGQIEEHGPASDLGAWYLGDERHGFLDAGRLGELLRRRFVWLPANAALIRRADLVGVGGYRPSLRWHSDWFALYSIAARHGVVCISDALTLFQLSPRSMSFVGMRNGAQQRGVMNAILDQLRGADFRDFRRLLRAGPAAFSPFLPAMVGALLRRPRDWDMLMAVALWWLGAASRLERPGFLRRMRRPPQRLSTPSVRTKE